MRRKRKRKSSNQYVVFQVCETHFCARQSERDDESEHIYDHEVSESSTSSGELVPAAARQHRGHAGKARAAADSKEEEEESAAEDLASLSEVSTRKRAQPHQHGQQSTAKRGRGAPPR